MPVIVRLGGGGGLMVKPIEGLTATVGMSEPGRIVCNWIIPDDANYIGVMIRYKEGDYPVSIADGLLAYDSNIAAVRDENTTCIIDGLVDGTKYFIRAFAFTVKGGKRIYNSRKTEGSCTTAIPQQTKGQIIITESGPVTLPYGVSRVDVFGVGGGGGAAGRTGNSREGGAGGAGGGYVATKKGVTVSLGATLQAVVGAGGKGAAISSTGGTITSPTNGGDTVLYDAQGSEVLKATGGRMSSGMTGGAGGSGGGTTLTTPGTGGNGPSVSAGDGGQDGSDGGQSHYNSNGSAYQAAYKGGAGSRATTRAFGEPDGTLYGSGGGGGGSMFDYQSTGSSATQYETYSAGPGSGGPGAGSGGSWSSVNGRNGGANTGGGGGGACARSGTLTVYHSPANGGSGGSGVIIIRWGF